MSDEKKKREVMDGLMKRITAIMTQVREGAVNRVLESDPEIIHSFLRESGMEKSILIDGFQRAFVGVVWGADCERRALYDYEECINILMKDDEMSREQAVEYMEFNVEHSYLGDPSPLFFSSLKIPQEDVLAILSPIIDGGTLFH